MCGIAGSIGIDISSGITKVLQRISRRGPDGHNVFEIPAQQVMFAHARLAIIDVTTGASQPMVYADRYVITYNGELYNYAEIRKELLSEGYQFHSQSDTEVVLAAYAHWKEECVVHFRGMFAFAIWDKETATLFAARDRFGIKPFYYFHTQEGFVFASLVTALLDTGIVPRVLNLSGLSVYLQTGAFAHPQTVIKDVLQIPPASFLILKENKVEMKQYWDVLSNQQEAAQITHYPEAVAATRKQLEEAVAYHLVADVPVGAFLSGGIDSCAITGLMASQVKKPLQTFTIGFEKKYEALNELKWAKWSAERFQTEHYEIILTETDIENDIDALIDAIDQPSLDGTNTFFVSKATAAVTKVAITGAGADELLGGYSHFRYSMLAQKVLPGGTSLNGLKHLTDLLPPRFGEPLRFLLNTPLERSCTIRNYGTAHTVSHKMKACTPLDMQAALQARYAPYINATIGPFKQTSLVEINTYLVDTLLRDGDALSMYHGLETRPVFLDHQLAAFLFHLKDDFKIRNGVKKAVLVDAVSDLLPEEVKNRRKTGFELPLRRWLYDVFKTQYAALLDGPTANRIFTKEYLLFLKNGLAQGHTDNLHWAVFVLLKYMDKFKLEVEDHV